jgi:hypothetical protein
MTEEQGTLLAIFDDSVALEKGVRAALDGGNESMEVLSPIPLPELDELLPQKPSQVRWFTLAGCVAGAVMGLAFQIATVLQWPHLTGGKPPISLPAFVVISFEMSILVGAVATFVGLMKNARLPEIWKQYFHDGCSQADFAILLKCEQSKLEQTKGLLTEAGAREVRAAEPESVWPEIKEK